MLQNIRTYVRTCYKHTYIRNTDRLRTYIQTNRQTEILERVGHWQTDSSKGVSDLQGRHLEQEGVASFDVELGGLVHAVQL